MYRSNIISKEISLTVFERELENGGPLNTYLHYMLCFVHYRPTQIAILRLCSVSNNDGDDEESARLDVEAYLELFNQVIDFCDLNFHEWAMCLSLMDA